MVFFLKKHETEMAVSKLDEFLKDLQIKILNFSIEDFIAAAKAWRNNQ